MTLISIVEKPKSFTSGVSDVVYRIERDDLIEHPDELDVQAYCQLWEIPHYWKVTKSYETGISIERQTMTFEQIDTPELSSPKPWPPLGDVDHGWGRHPGMMDDGGKCLRGSCTDQPMVYWNTPDSDGNHWRLKRRLIAGFDMANITEPEKHLIWGAHGLLVTAEALLDRESGSTPSYPKWDWRNGQPRKEAQSLWDNDYAAMWDDLAAAVRKARGASDTEEYTS